MNRKNLAATATSKKLSVKKQTVQDLPATKSGAEKVRGGASMDRRQLGNSNHNETLL